MSIRDEAGEGFDRLTEEGHLFPSARGTFIQGTVWAQGQADREPSDAEVEAGCAAFYEGAQGITSRERLNAAEPALADRYRDGIRAALLAAQEVRRG